MKSLTTAIVLDDLNRFSQDIKQHFGGTPDLITRRKEDTLVIYISGIVDPKRLERDILEPLSNREPGGPLVIETPNLQETDNIQTMVQSILSGSAVIAIQGKSKVLLADISSFPHRSIEKPDTEIVIRGPRESLTELLETNVAIIRRILQSDKLRMKVWHIGTLTRTEVRLLYLEGITPKSLVDEMTQRIDKIRIDAVMDSNSIEEMIRDHQLSLFPTIQNTERPDVVVASLLDGKVSILTNNSPFALIAPFQLWTAFQSREDYYLSYGSATFIRIIRGIFIALALVMPSFYVAITTFHPEMLPANLLLSFASARESAPLPAVVEAMTMEIIFEGLREAAVRLPRSINQAVSILGALVIGQAIVQTGLISTPMVIVVSITGIASLIIPRYNMSFPFRILRFFLLVLAGSLGLFGIVFGLFFIGIYLTGVRSAGVPYLAPVAPLKQPGIKDFLIRPPLRFLKQNSSGKIKTNNPGDQQ